MHKFFVYVCYLFKLCGTTPSLNFFRAEKIYFHAEKKYFHAEKICFHALEIKLPVVEYF